MTTRAVGLTLVMSFLPPAAFAMAQEPGPPTHQTAPGTVMLVGASVEVTKSESVRVQLACSEGEAACAGTLRITTVKPFAPTKSKAKRKLTVVETSIGELAGGKLKTFHLPLHKDVRAHVRRARTTRVEWKVTRPEGTEQPLSRLPKITLISEVAG